MSIKDIKLKSEEEIKLILKRYILTLLWLFFLAFLFLLIDFFFMFWLFQKNYWGIPVFILGIILSFAILIKVYFLRTKNILIITNQRIIDIHRQSFLNKTVSEIPYDLLEDVSSKSHGFWATLFRYGTLNIQAGNGKVVLLAEKIRRPTLIQQKINNYREKYLLKFSLDFSGNVANKIISHLPELEKVDLLKVNKAVEKMLERIAKIG